MSTQEEEDAFIEGFHGILESEKQRSKMSPSTLAVRLSSCDKGSPAYILLEHELNRRIAKIQAVPAYVGIVSGLVGVLLGAWLQAPTDIPSNAALNCQANNPTPNLPSKRDLLKRTPYTKD